MTEGAAVSWEGPGEPIVLIVYGPSGEVAVPVLQKRALELAKELSEPAVTAIRTKPVGQGLAGLVAIAPWRSGLYNREPAPVVYDFDRPLRNAFWWILRLMS